MNEGLNIREEIKNIREQQNKNNTGVVRTHDDIERDRQEVQKIFERREAEQKKARIREALELYDRIGHISYDDGKEFHQNGFYKLNRDNYQKMLMHV